MTPLAAYQPDFCSEVRVEDKGKLNTFPVVIFLMCVRYTNNIGSICPVCESFILQNTYNPNQINQTVYTGHGSWNFSFSNNRKVNLNACGQWQLSSLPLPASFFKSWWLYCFSWKSRFCSRWLNVCPSFLYTTTILITNNNLGLLLLFYELMEIFGVMYT